MKRDDVWDSVPCPCCGERLSVLVRVPADSSPMQLALSREAMARYVLDPREGPALVVAGQLGAAPLGRWA